MDQQTNRTTRHRQRSPERSGPGTAGKLGGFATGTATVVSFGGTVPFVFTGSVAMK
ncbi:hypothetical protein ACWEK5_23515 [Rhodococcus koreensis]